MKQRHNLLGKVAALLMLMVGWLAAMPLAQPAQAAAHTQAARPEARLDKAALVEARIDKHGGGTRVSFDMTAPVRFGIIALTDPYRIVIELEEVHWQLASREIAVGDEIVSRVRYGLFRPGTSRIVLDCERPAVVDGAYVAGAGPGRYQLVVDLAAVSHAAFLQSLESPPAIAHLNRLDPPAPTYAAATSAMPGPGLASAGGLPPEAALFVREVAVTMPPAAQLTALPFAPPPRKPLSVPGKPVIVIDPGHGGSDPGAISVSGVYEKTVALRAARLVQEELRRSGRYNVLLTRNGDEAIRLRDRVAFARAAQADLFISLHADANPNKAVRGASVYTLSEKASDAEAAALAERENKADLISGVDLSHEAPEVANILIDLAQRETMNQSARVAKLLVQNLGRRTTLVRNTHRFAGFAVLTAPDVPAVLVELGHLSNPEDARLLQQEGYLRSLAEAIAEAVNGYFTVEMARQ
jgi:N-acetylmuramoyl-L-alanine amidase